MNHFNALFSIPLLVLLLLTSPSCPAKEVSDEWYEFSTDFKMIWPVGFDLKPLPWTDHEKQWIRTQMQAVAKLAPGLVQRLSAYRPLRLYRDATPSNSYAAAAVPSHNAMMLRESAFKKSGNSDRLLLILLHEMAHVADPIDRIAVSPQWLKIVKPRIDKVHKALAKAGTPMGSQRAASLQAKHPKLAASVGLPTIYSAGNALEALAETTTHMLLGHYRPPPDIEQFLQQHLLGTPYQPEPALRHVHLGAALHAAGKLKPAYDAYSAALKEDRNLTIVYLLRGYVFEDSGRRDNAAIDYLSSLRGDWRWAYQDGVRWKLSRILPKLRSDKVLLPILEELLAGKPDSGDYRYRYAETLRRAGRCKDALPEYDRAIKSGIKAHQGRGQCRAEKGDYSDAVADYDIAATAFRYPAPQLLLLRGIAKLKLGKTEEAVADLNGAKRLPSLKTQAERWLREAEQASAK